MCSFLVYCYTLEIIEHNVLAFPISNDVVFYYVASNSMAESPSLVLVINDTKLLMPCI